MAKGCTSNTYEEARKQRLEENKKRFEDLGILKISKNLTKLATPEKKTLQHRSTPKSKSKSNDVVELRRSSRMRNLVPSYHENLGMEMPTLRKRSRSSSSAWGSYIARPLDEIKEATEEERNRALMAAEELLSNLQSSNPTFIKSMGLPTRFCEEHLPKTVCDMVLEDEKGSEYEAVFIGNRTGLSGGWRAFALDHKLDDGDALIFELVEPARFKIYIVKAYPDLVEDGMENLDEEETTCATKKQKSQSNKAQKPKKQNIVHEINESAGSEDHLAENNVDNEAEPKGINSTRKTRFSQRKSQESEDSKLLIDDDSEKKEHIEEGKDCTAEKAKAAMKNNSQASKTRRSKQRCVVHESGDDLGSTEKRESKTEKENKIDVADAGKKNGFVEDGGSELKKVEAAGEFVSHKQRKKPAPKFFRKRA